MNLSVGGDEDGLLVRDAKEAVLYVPVIFPGVQKEIVAVYCGSLV